MAAQPTFGISYDKLVAMIPFVMDFLDLHSDDVIASGILDDHRLDDAAIAMILSYEKARNNTAGPTSVETLDKAESESRSTKETKAGEEPLHHDLAPALSNSVTADSFKTRYRMNEAMFEALMQDLVKLTSFVEKSQKQVGPEPLSSVDALMLTLRFLGCRLPMSQLAVAANISETLYSSVVHDTMEALYELLPHYILWPDENRVVEISDKFRQRSGLQGVLGIIDVLHIPVKTPDEHADFYTNQQNETTVVLQSVCDHRLRFIHSCTGWPGSMDEETVLKDSDLHIDDRDDVSFYFPFDSYLVGDEGYCLSPWLMTPFADTGNLSTLQQQFNSACQHILQDNTLMYSLLMHRFPRLEYVEMKDMQSTVLLILVCCALHNFCLDNEDQEVCEDFKVTVRNMNTVPESPILNQSEEGESKRHHVLQLLQEL